MNPEHDPSIRFEPQYRPSKTGARDDGVDAPLGIDPAVVPFSQDSVEDVDHSVWDEPSLPFEIRTQTGKQDLTYENWLSARQRGSSEWQSWMLTILIACLSGPWGLVTVFLYGYQWGAANFVFGCLIAPLVQELGKIAIMLWVVEKRPFWFKGWFQIFFCSMVSATSFVIAFNWLTWMFDSAPFGTLFQWTAFFSMHLIASSVSAVGLEKIWRDTNFNRRRPSMDKGYPWFRAAFFINAIFTLVVLLSQWIIEFIDLH